MRKTAIILGSCVSLLSAAGPVRSGDQLQRQQAATKANISLAHISAVSQNFDHVYSIYLIVNGLNFPPKSGANGIARYVRLVQTRGRVVTRGPIYYTGNTGNWTSTQIDDFVPMQVVAGRTYRVGLIECVEPGPSPKKLISNEVEYFLLMMVESAAPNPVPAGTTEIEVATTNVLGSQGAKVVRFGGQPASVTQWNGATRNFKVRVPATLAVPGVHELWLEEGARTVSNKIQVRLLGPAIR